MITPAPTRSLAGANVLIVGASGGIGGAVAASLRRRGAMLALAGRVAGRVDAAGHGEPFLTYDLADATAAKPLVDATVAALGAIDGVICCAGAVAFGPLDELPVRLVEELVAVNLVGPLALAQAAIPALRRGGFVLNVSGIVAELPTAGLVAYSAAKAGVSAGFRALAREVRPRGITIIDARPPHTETGLADRPRFGSAPKMRAGLDPAKVAERLTVAIEMDERDVPGSAFTA